MNAVPSGRSADLKSPVGLCVWDLDGTLVDSLRDIAEALNECLELLALPSHPVESYRYMVGEGVPRLCQRAIGHSHPYLLGRLTELARTRYRARVIRHTRPYEGVVEAVAAVGRAGVAQAVLSNKPHELTCRVVEAFWPAGTFAVVQGYVEEDRRKPDPRCLEDICRAVGVAPERALMIGDTPTDVMTARGAGVRPIGVAWGFRQHAELVEAGAERVIERPEEVARLLSE